MRFIEELRQQQEREAIRRSSQQEEQRREAQGRKDAEKATAETDRLIAKAVRNSLVPVISKQLETLPSVIVQEERNGGFLTFWIDDPSHWGPKWDFFHASGNSDGSVAIGNQRLTESEARDLDKVNEAFSNARKSAKTSHDPNAPFPPLRDEWDGG